MTQSAMDELNAQRFIRMHGDRVRWVKGQGQFRSSWFVFNGKHWVGDDFEAQRLVLEVCRDVHLQSINRNLSNDQWRELSEQAYRMENREGIRRVLSLAKKYLTARVFEFEGEPWKRVAKTIMDVREL